MNREINSIKGFINIREADFLYQLAKKTVEQFGRDSVLCEIGSYCGKSTVSIASALKEKNAGVLYAIDWHQGSPHIPGFDAGAYQSTRQDLENNLEKFGVQNYVKNILNRSEDSIHLVPEKMHFLWIDGQHDFKSVKADCDNFAKKIVDTGYLVFHDACWTEWVEPFQFINKEILDNPHYNLFAVMENIIAFRKEKNKANKTMLVILRTLCSFVSGSGRLFYKRLISFVLRQITFLIYLLNQKFMK